MRAGALLHHAVGRLAGAQSPVPERGRDYAHGVDDVAPFASDTAPTVNCGVPVGLRFPRWQYAPLSIWVKAMVPDAPGLVKRTAFRSAVWATWVSRSCDLPAKTSGGCGSNERGEASSIGSGNGHVRPYLFGSLPQLGSDQFRRLRTRTYAELPMRGSTPCAPYLRRSLALVRGRQTGHVRFEVPVRREVFGRQGIPTPE